MAPRSEEAGTSGDRWGWGRLASAQLQSQVETLLWFPVSCAPGAVACASVGLAMLSQVGVGPVLKLFQPHQPQLCRGGPRLPAPNVVGSDLWRKGVTVVGRSKSGLEGD